MRIRVILIAVVLSAGLAACADPGTPSSTSAQPQPTQPPRTLNVLTHESFDLSQEVLEEFESANHAVVKFLKLPDAGQALTRAMLTRDDPEADVIFGVDNTFFSRAIEADILESYAPPALAGIPADFQLDPQARLTPIDFGDVCLNYDTAYFAEHGLQPPQALADLTQPEYKDLLVVENPAGSSPGLAFMLATVGVFGEEGWLDYWRQLKDNGVKVVEDWTTAYYTEFSGSSGKGPRPIVVSYSSSPPFEMLGAPSSVENPPTAAVVAPDTCFRQIEFAGILKGTRNRDLAEKWIDFMLGVRYQEDILLKQFVYPVNPQARLPEAFARYSVLTDRPIKLSQEAIAANRDRWIEAWTETVLR